MPNMLQRLTLGGAVFAATLVLSAPSHGQSFSVDTTVTQTASQYTYAFTLNYDQAGAVQGLTNPIYDWTFYIDPNLPTPTAIALPTGWKDTYDPTSGQFDFYTEGPNGFGNGDFGPNVILAGQSLSGFGLTTPAAPDVSIASVTDELFNQDATTAMLPTSAPAPVPEASTVLSLGLGMVGLGILAFRRRARQS